MTGPKTVGILSCGRLVIPCNHVIADIAFNHVIYSDDDGKNWRLGGSTEGNTDENQIVELTDGSLMLNMGTIKFHPKQADVAAAAPLTRVFDVLTTGKQNLLTNLNFRFIVC